MQHPGYDDVIDIGPVASDEARVLAPGDPLPDEPTRRGGRHTEWSRAVEEVTLSPLGRSLGGPRR